MTKQKQKSAPEGKHDFSKHDFSKKFKIPFFMSRPKPIVPRRLVALFTIFLTVIILYGSITAVMHQRSLHKHITDPTQQLQNKQIIGYLDSPVFTPNNLDFLSPDEKAHMTDVKNRLDVLFIMYLVSLGIVIGIIAVFFVKKLWTRFDELLARTMRATGWTLLGICFFFGMAAMLSFTKFWYLIHGLLFPAGNWMFAYNSTLITLYPQSFFTQFIVRILLLLSSTGLVFVLISWFMMKMHLADHQFSEIHEKKMERAKEEFKEKIRK